MFVNVLTFLWHSDPTPSLSQRWGCLISVHRLVTSDYPVCQPNDWQMLYGVATVCCPHQLWGWVKVETQLGKMAWADSPNTCHHRAQGERKLRPQPSPSFALHHHFLPFHTTPSFTPNYFSSAQSEFKTRVTKVKSAVEPQITVISCDSKVSQLILYHPVSQH